MFAKTRYLGLDMWISDMYMVVPLHNQGKSRMDICILITSPLFSYVTFAYKVLNEQANFTHSTFFIFTFQENTFPNELAFNIT